MRRKATSPPNRFKVGDQVVIQWGFHDVDGMIVEDRGPIGVGGRRLYRIRFILDPELERFTELSEEDFRAKVAG